MPTFFNLHYGHLKKSITRLCDSYGIKHCNIVEHDGTRRGWFEDHSGQQSRIMAFDKALTDAGGINAFRFARDRT